MSTDYFETTFSSLFVHTECAFIFNRQNLKTKNVLWIDQIIFVSYLQNRILRQKIAVKFLLYH